MQSNAAVYRRLECLECQTSQTLSASARRYIQSYKSQPHIVFSVFIITLSYICVVCYGYRPINKALAHACPLLGVESVCVVCVLCLGERWGRQGKSRRGISIMLPKISQSKSVLKINHDRASLASMFDPFEYRFKSAKLCIKYNSNAIQRGKQFTVAMWIIIFRSAQRELYTAGLTLDQAIMW